MCKFSRHVNFEDITNQAFSQFYFRGSPSILLSDSCKSKFTSEISRMKISWMASSPRKPQKLHPLKICMHTVYNIPQVSETVWSLTISYIVKCDSMWIVILFCLLRVQIWPGYWCSTEGMGPTETGWEGMCDMQRNKTKSDQDDFTA